MDFKVGSMVHNKKLDENMKIVDVFVGKETGTVVYMLSDHKAKVHLVNGCDIEEVDSSRVEIRFDYGDKEVYCKIYLVNEEIETELGIGYGYVMDKGYTGIIQAASWAMKKAYEEVAAREEKEGKQ